MELLDEGCTLPFIARYRKERTGSLSDEQLRQLEGELKAAQALEDRREAILKSLAEQQVSDPAILSAVQAADERQVLEDLYLPYKKSRSSKAARALERGLGGLAKAILDPRELRRPEDLATQFINKELGVESREDALQGARDIIVEDLASHPELRKNLREKRRAGRLEIKATRGKKSEAEASVYRELIGLSARLADLKPHRILAIDRGEREGLLSVSIPGDEERELNAARALIAPSRNRPADSFITETIQVALQDRLGPACERELRRELTELAHTHSIGTFRINLRQLLMQAPLGQRSVLAVDPGFRNGCKCALVDPQGRFVEAQTIFPHSGAGRAAEARGILEDLASRHEVAVIAIGNGTAARETRDFIAGLKLANKPAIALVNEAGASIYSASELATKEHPELDVLVRGALSIARRVQDPLAELVKIAPRHLGVGQYQHDLEEKALDEALEGVVEQAVNEVGVALNQASEPLLERVSGIGPKLARAIAEHRKSSPFKNRSELRKVKGLGPKAFEQAAGFLRIEGGSEPLDNTGVHPESYELARRIAAKLGQPIAALLGDRARLEALDPKTFAVDGAGIETVRDVLSELANPGRDPRGEAESIQYAAEARKMEDLKPGMMVTGVVTNLTDFGSFVDIGVHRDGLIHISRFGRRIKHPSEIVSIGSKVKARVESVDIERNRISLEYLG